MIETTTAIIIKMGANKEKVKIAPLVEFKVPEIKIIDANTNDERMYVISFSFFNWIIEKIKKGIL